MKLYQYEITKDAVLDIKKRLNDFIKEHTFEDQTDDYVYAEDGLQLHFKPLLEEYFEPVLTDRTRNNIDRAIAFSYILCNVEHTVMKNGRNLYSTVSGLFADDLWKLLMDINSDVKNDNLGDDFNSMNYFRDLLEG